MQNDSLTHEVFVDIKTADHLKRSFIPFLKNTGLFIPKDEHDYGIGEEVWINLKLSDETNVIRFLTKVIWLPAKQITDPFTKGIGVEFCEPQHEFLRKKVFHVDHTE